MKRRKWLIHGIFWGLYSLSLLADPRLSQDWIANFIYISERIIAEGSAFFITTEWFIPRMIKNLKNVTNWFLFLFAAAVISYLDKNLINEFNKTLPYQVPKFSASYIQFFLNTTWIMLIASGISLMYYLYEEKIKIQEAETLKTRAELSLLRYKINPHFFFNTLNNLYAFSQLDPSRSSDIILKLSGLMRYVIYNDDAYVLLAKEIEFIKDYVELESLRFHNPEDIVLKIEGDPKQCTVMPFVLLPFVENCFKHAGRSPLDDSFRILIHIKITDNQLNFFSENTVALTEQKPSSKGEHFGLQTVLRRLDLIYGKQRYDIDIRCEQHLFSVRLKIIL
ncbi:MAG: histidine kinase [Chitinophagales bacterium]|nr:histidine kinase [Chitinophagales bacterium]